MPIAAQKSTHAAAIRQIKIKYLHAIPNMTHSEIQRNPDY